MFLKKRVIDLEKENSQLKQTLESLDNRMRQHEDMLETIGNLQMENGRLVEEQEKLRIKMWHMGFEYDRIISKMQLDEMDKNYPENRKKLQEYKGMYSGKRCFIIGNGPSLRKDDLELIKNEFSFACNRIGAIYEETLWRPSFYFCTDEIAYSARIAELCKNAGQVFLPIDFKDYLSVKYSNVIFYPLFRRYTVAPEFASNVLQGVYDAGTVLYIATQFAIYMGFEEIILIGVDADWETKELDDGRILIDLSAKKNHFYKENQDDLEGMKKNVEWMDFSDTLHTGIYGMIDGWKMIRYQTEQKGISVINATRGGKLDVFPRKSIEEILAE